MRIKDLGLYRTFKSNYVPYFTDGNGRDRYIAFNNAGFFPNKETNKENVRRTGTSLDTKISYKYVSPYMKAPNFHYHSDGNGRDSYIFSNGGGLYYDSKPLNSYKLTDFLRADNFTTSYNKTGKVWVSKSQDKYNKILRAKEKDIINRLYENEKKKFIKTKKENDENSQEESKNEYKYLYAFIFCLIFFTASVLVKDIIDLKSITSPEYIKTFVINNPNVEFSRAGLSGNDFVIR